MQKKGNCSKFRRSQIANCPYKRYVDDIYLQRTNEETADHFHHIINNVDPNLKFEIEKPETTPSAMSLSLLDFKVTISKDGNSSFQFYRKPAKKPLFVHHQSAIPTKSKLNFIRNERKLIQDRCSSHISATQHLNTFDHILRLNGYPKNSIEESKRPQHHQRNSQPANTEWTYLKIPYISDRLNHRITNIFKKETSQCASLTSPTQSERLYPTSPKYANAPGTSAPSLTPDFVYEEMQYTGSRVTAAVNNTLVARHASSTTDRVKEHLNDENSSVKKHIYSCQNKDHKVFIGPLLINGPLLEPYVPFTVYFHSFHT